MVQPFKKTKYRARKSELQRVQELLARLEKLEVGNAVKSIDYLYSQDSLIKALLAGLFRADINVDVVSNDYDIVFQSPMLEKVFGKVDGRPCYKHYRDLDKPCDPCSMMRAIENNCITTTDIDGKDGRYYQVVSVPLLDFTGESRFAFNIIMDITERKQSEEKLQESEELYRNLVETADKAGVAISIAQNVGDQEGVIVFANREFSRITGYTREEIIGNTLHSILPPAQVSELMDRYRRRQAGEELPSYTDLSFIRKDGTVVPVEYSTAMMTYQGKMSAIAFITDITERRQAELKLRDSERRYRELADLLPQIIFEVDERGIVTFSNQKGYESLGYTHADIEKGLNMLQLLVPDNHDRAIADINIVLGGEELPGTEYTLLRKDGDSLPVEVFTSPILREGKPSGLRGIVIDISERKAAEEERTRMQEQLREYSENLEQMVIERTQQLEDANKALIRTEKLATIGELAGSIAHELRNPLGAVKTSTSFLKMSMRGDTDEKLTKHLNILEKQADICSDIISGLLDFSRPAKLEIGVVDINQLLRELVRNTGIPKNVKISTRLARELTPIMADRGHLERVFSNLVSNAMEAMPDGGKLLLSTNQNSGFIEVRVADTGKGILKENLPKVFEPLFTTKTNGVGLGLSLSRALMERQGGNINVQSQVGKGTTFRVRIPIAGDG